MKTVCACIFTVMVCGMGYVMYRDFQPGHAIETLPASAIDYQRMRWESARRETAAEWADRVYGDLYRDSGVPEVDEALRAHRALRALPTHAWPHEWIMRDQGARRLLDKQKEELPEVPERLVGASEYEQPRWAGERGWREWEAKGNRL